VRITKRILWPNKLGGVSVTDPGWTQEGETEEEAIARVVASIPGRVPVIAPGAVPVVVENDDLTAMDPGDRFFNAWRIMGGRVVVDLEAAKALLEGEVTVRRQATPAKVARVRAGLQAARTLAELRALVDGEGWHQARPAYTLPQGSSEEDG
jgi:hypothetical protein